MATIDIRGAYLSSADPPIATNPNPDLAWKAPVLVATTGSNITLSGVQAIDGITVGNNDERVLVKDQTDQTGNGLYNAATGPWTRTIDAANNSQFSCGMQVAVTGGITNAGVNYKLTSANPITLGSTDLTFAAQSATIAALLIANNLSDVASASAALSNLGGAPLASPAFTGAPTAPTPTAGDNSSKLATTAFVQNAVATHSGGATFDGTIVIAPPAGSTTKGLNITQSSPATGSVVGQLFYNEIQVTHSCGVTGPSNQAYGLCLGFTTGGSSQTGRAIGLASLLNHNANSTSGSDHIAFLAQAYSSAVDTSGGEIYAGNLVAIAASGADVVGLVGLEIDSEADSGATVPLRETLRIVNQGANRAATTDTAITFTSTNGGGSFASLLHLSDEFGAAPIAAAGNFLDADSAQTIANLIYLPSMTISDYVIKVPGFVVAGGGVTAIGTGTPNTGVLLQVSGNTATLPAPTYSGTVLQFANADNANTRVLLDSFGSSAPSMNFRRALGTGGSPSAVSSGALLGAISFSGYGTSQYNSTDTALIYAVASQNFTNTANGTELVFYPIANGGLTGAEAIRILNGGNVKFTNSANFTANGTKAMSLGSTGPSAANASPQEWLTIVDSGGTTRYVPCF